MVLFFLKLRRSIHPSIRPTKGSRAHAPTNCCRHGGRRFRASRARHCCVRMRACAAVWALSRRLRGPAVFIARPEAPGGSVGCRARSAAGVTWTNRTSSAPWAAREGHASVIDAAGAIYVIGGWNGNYIYYSDVWASTDGGAVVEGVLKGYVQGTQEGYQRGTQGWCARECSVVLVGYYRVLKVYQGVRGVLTGYSRGLKGTSGVPFGHSFGSCAILNVLQRQSRGTRRLRKRNSN